MKVDFIIFYEHIARELEASKLLKKDLEKKGLKGVILPIHFNRYINAIKYDPKIVILPFLYKYNDSFFAKTFNEFNKALIVANLHSEQIGNKESQSRMMPLDEKSKNVHHFVWGKFFSELLKKSGIDDELIHPYGSVRNDLLYKYKEIKEDKNTILIPTSFSMTFVDSSYIESAIKKRNINRKDFMKSLEFRTKSRNAFFEIIHKLSLQFPKQTFKLRPHPYVDINEYKKAYCESNSLTILPENVVIERKGSIAEAISKVNSVIIWHSTSILEARIMGKRVFQLAPFEFDQKNYMEYMNYIPRGSTLEECIDFVNNKKSINLEKLDDYISEVYGKVDGKSSQRIAEKVEALLIENERNKQRSLKHFLLFIKLLRKCILIDLPKNLLARMNLLDKVKPHYKGILEDREEVK